MKCKNNLSLVMRTRVLRRPIVILRVRCSICVRCNILIFFNENCSLQHSYVVASLVLAYLTVFLIFGEWRCLDSKQKTSKH